jgi:uncharacterized protein YegL
MVDKNYTDITLLLDESGSMYPISLSVIDSVNKFIKEQKLCSHKCLFSLVTFNTVMSERICACDINSWEPITTNNYQPNGGTALLDALGYTIDRLGFRLQSLPQNQRPGNVIVVVMTDGYENASITFKPTGVKEKIVHQTSKYNWDFIYLGANQDSFLVSKELGFKANLTANYDHDMQGVDQIYSQVSNHILSSRTGSEKIHAI